MINWNLKRKAAVLVFSLMAILPATQAITPEELVYDQVSKYVSAQQAADISRNICDAAATYHVDPVFATAVFTTESHFDNTAVSGVGAIGIAQLMPDTAAYLNVNPYNVRENIFGGVKYLGQMMDRYKTWDKPFMYAAAAYNAGPGAVDRAGGVPHYAETMNYVQTVENTRQDIWRIAGMQANTGRMDESPVATTKVNAPVFPALKEWHENQTASAVSPSGATAMAQEKIGTASHTEHVLQRSGKTKNNDNTHLTSFAK
ncbi:lytic transglycosylase domain-containing protein [Megasphaera hominis]|uniref:Lytic transglycosylase domain-containing protein n=1 Tax=Megasphaera hominis TaxID=159836 RepID=A0ABR6VIY4_9FIRM|nr:lytic transglycosylase domain-containing protein [Megasphaera hominis]MBC3536670.1 lytic transglycosylase domain-containing protein [Megasphaera hominis]